jgi:hypothetical protein
MLPRAVPTFDIAARRNRQMNPPVLMTIPPKTGMTMNTFLPIAAVAHVCLQRIKKRPRRYLLGLWLSSEPNYKLLKFNFCRAN